MKIVYMYNYCPPEQFHLTHITPPPPAPQKLKVQGNRKLYENKDCYRLDCYMEAMKLKVIWGLEQQGWDF